METNRNNVRGEQWDGCQRCGFWYPISQLTIQDGLRICREACFDPRPDNVRWREITVGSTLASINPEEGTDTLWLDVAFSDDLPTS